MGKSIIQHSCGHTESHQLQGKISDRERRERYLQGTLCSACYQAEQQRKSAAAAAANVDQEGLPALTGSPKQIAWAESIRAGLIAEAEQLIARAEGHPAARSIPSVAAGIDAARQALAEMRGQISASWWIDRRPPAANPVQQAASAAYKAVGA